MVVTRWQQGGNKVVIFSYGQVKQSTDYHYLALFIKCHTVAPCVRGICSRKLYSNRNLSISYLTHTMQCFLQDFAIGGYILECTQHV